MSKFLLGADPEMFVRTKGLSRGPGKTTGGLIVPVCGKVGGTKDKPLPFVLNVPAGAPRMGEYKYQEDNVAFEVNIPPARDASQFDSSIRTVLELSAKLLASKGLTYDLKKSAHRFSVFELMHPSAQTIGCDPDMCAYGGAKDNPIAREPFDIKDLGTWRFTGGHVHFGYDLDTGIPPHVMVRLIDAVVYLPLVAEDRQKARRTKYGLAGLYRVKPYGVEYRSMSNFWLNSPRRVADRAFRLLFDVRNNLDALFDFYQALPIEEVQACINAGGEGWKQVWAKITELPNFDNLEIRNNQLDAHTPRSKYPTLAEMVEEQVMEVAVAGQG